MDNDLTYQALVHDTQLCYSSAVVCYGATAVQCTLERPACFFQPRSTYSPQLRLHNSFYTRARLQVQVCGCYLTTHKQLATKHGTAQHARTMIVQARIVGSQHARCRCSRGSRRQCCPSHELQQGRLSSSSGSVTGPCLGRTSPPPPHTAFHPHATPTNLIWPSLYH